MYLYFNEIDDYGLCVIATVLVYFLNAKSGIAVGKARKEYEVPILQTQGPPEFERVFRAHCNNAEQYPQLLALMWTFAVFVQKDLAGALGIFWIVMRHMYTKQYHESADNVERYTIPADYVLKFYSIGLIFALLYEYSRRI